MKCRNLNDRIISVTETSWTHQTPFSLEKYIVQDTEEKKLEKDKIIFYLKRGENSSLKPTLEV